jgi:hypothetical protein
MIQISYVSRATAPMSSEQLLDLLQTCLGNNAGDGITGMLLYGNETFLQSLEGDEDVVDGLLERIREDSRHTDIQVLHRRSIRRREYSDWSMGFKRVSARELDSIGGMKDFSESDFNMMYLVQHKAAVQTLLEHYRDPAAATENAASDPKDRLIEAQKNALTRIRGYVELASLMLESIAEASRKGSLSEAHLRLCEAALESLHQV